MMQRMKGTLRPGRKAGVLALAVLLLTCVLMAGAVSASGGETQFNESDFDDDNTYSIESGGTYVLNDDATGNITISAAENDDVILKAINGATLNGGIQINAERNVTIEGMHIKSTLISGDGEEARNLAIDLPDASIKLCLKNSTIDFAASDAPKGSSVIATNWALSDGSAIINNTISGVTAHVLNTAGVVDRGTLTVQGNTVTMNPNEKIAPGSNDKDQGKGRALLKLYHYALSSGVTYIVTDNVVKIPDDSHDATVVRVDKPTSIPNKITVTMYNNTYRGNSASPYLYGGSIYGYELEELSITVSETDKTRILVPGLNQTGVVWSGGADAANQELELNESGSYKLMGDFTTTGSGIQITADGVTLDGSEGKITTAGKLNGYILKVDVDDNENAAGVTLQNLDITGNVPSCTGTYGGVTVYAGTNTPSVPVTLTGSTVDMSQVTTESGMNPAVYFANAPHSQITNNEITAGNTEADGSSTPRAIVVSDGSDISISNNEITMGEAKKGVVSHAIQFQGPPTGVTISGNEITATSEDSLNRAVSLTTTGAEGESYVITGNTLTGKTFEAAVHVIIPSIEEGRSFNLEIEVVYDMPGNRTVYRPVPADTLVVVICDRLERRGIVPIVLFKVGTFDSTDKRYRGILYRMLETSVSGSRAGVIDGVGSRSHDSSMGIPCIYIECNLFDRLVACLEIEVVPLVAGACHDGVVAEVGIAGSPSYLVRASGHRYVLAEIGACIAEHLADPVIALHILIEVYILIYTECRHIAVLVFIPDKGEFILVPGKGIRVLDLDSIGIRHLLHSPVGIVGNGYLAACT